MKTISKILILLIPFIVLTSCKSDEILDNDEIQNDFLTKKMIDNVEYISNPHETSSYISDPNDADNEKVLSQLHNIGMLSRDLFKDNKYNSIIFKKASENANQTIGFTEFKVSIDTNEKFYSALAEAIENIDLTHASTNPNNYGEIENYVPAIYVPNIETADINKQPIVCSGIEVNSELDGMENYEDYVVAWFYDHSNNQWVEFLLDEETAMKTTNPVYIMDNAEEIMIARKKTNYTNNISNSGNSTKADQYSIHHFQHKFKLYKRFESNGRSEYNITGAGVNPDGVACNVLRRYQSGTFTSDRRLESVRKKHINKWRDDFERLTAVEPGTHVFWNTYERDWVSSSKSLGSATRDGVTIYLGGNRRNSGDYYGPKPSELNTHEFDTDITNSYLSFSNSKILVKN